MELHIFLHGFHIVFKDGIRTVSMGWDQCDYSSESFTISVGKESILGIISLENISSGNKIHNFLNISKT